MVGTTDWEPRRLVEADDAADVDFLRFGLAIGVGTAFLARLAGGTSLRVSFGTEGCC